MPQRVLFLSENLQLGGLLLMELWRAHKRGEIELVGVWSNAGPSRHQRVGAAAFAALKSSQEVTLPDNPLNESAIFNGITIENYAQLSGELGLRYQQVPNINGPAIAAALRGLEVDLGVCMGYGKILQEASRTAPRLGWLNFHPSLLPQYRGPFPGFWEFRHGAKQSGVSIHEMVAATDMGPIVAQKAIEITDAMTFRSLVIKQAKLGAELAQSVLPAYLKGEITTQPQVEGAGSSYPKPKPEDFLLTPDMSCDQVFSFVRGLRNVAKAIVLCGNEAMQIDSVISTNPVPSEVAPGSAQLMGHSRALFFARDGKVELQVSAFPHQNAQAK